MNLFLPCIPWETGLATYQFRVRPSSQHIGDQFDHYQSRWLRDKSRTFSFICQGNSTRSQRRDLLGHIIKNFVSLLHVYVWFYSD